MNPYQLHQEILELAKKHSFSTEVIYLGKPAPIVALKKSASNTHSYKPHVYISAGIHGDEPAGPFAIKKLLEEDFFGDEINWCLIPMVNTQGLELGTRENANGVDLNRDYKVGKTKEVAAHLKWFTQQKSLKYDLTLSLHEDWESSGFYCYAILPDLNESTTRIIRDIAHAVQKVSPINLSEMIEGVKAKGGFIVHDIHDFKKILDDWADWPEAFFLINSHLNSLHFTFETASEQALKQRVDTHCAAIRAAVGSLLNPPAKKPIKMN